MTATPSKRPLRRRPRVFRGGLTTVGLGGLGVLCAIVVTGCGSSSNNPSTTTAAAGTTVAASTVTTPTGTSTNPGAGFTAYRSCLTAHGLTGFGAGAGGGFFRRGGAGGAGASTSTSATATTPTSTTGTTPAFQRPALSAADQKALAACASLRPSGGFGGFGGAGRFSSNPKFVACLKAHGVSVSSSGTPSFGGGASSSFRTALSACRSLLPSGSFGGGFGGAGGGGGAAGANSATFARYQACLTAHGITPGAAGSSSSAKLAAAMAACRSILSSGSSSASTTTGTTPTTTSG